MGNNPFSGQVSSGSPESGQGRVSVLKQMAVFKTRTKLLGIFAIMLIGLFYANTIIVEQTQTSNSSIESQSKIMANQAVLSDAISCFGAVKYWFAILDNGLKKT